MWRMWYFYRKLRSERLYLVSWNICTAMFMLLWSPGQELPWLFFLLEMICRFVSNGDFNTAWNRDKIAMSQGFVQRWVTVLQDPWCCTFTVNSLRLIDAIWRHRSGSTLAQAMACCLTVPGHYLNQCWLMISDVLWHSPDSNFTENT